ncbi:hypothetical protein DFH07DRAFT_1060041 [Mycena maculata]|uniref:Uncharacterized protein n=1 Tax=Mycena maculata TaxID=230809 RepID=A0AAD7JC45_9AGAR|nr:hypothetical protein DFH07DRAFT_1060041 [Mycena maculata]
MTEAQKPLIDDEGESPRDNEACRKSFTTTKARKPLCSLGQVAVKSPHVLWGNQKSSCSLRDTDSAQELGWGPQAAADVNGEIRDRHQPRFRLVVLRVGGVDLQAGQPVSADNVPRFCLTVSALESANATISVQPCINDVSFNPDPTQMFQWVGTAYITYGFAFIGNQSVPVGPSSATDYVPSLVNAMSTTAAYIRLDYSPGRLPASTGLETGMVLALSESIEHL